MCRVTVKRNVIFKEAKYELDVILLLSKKKKKIEENVIPKRSSRSAAETKNKVYIPNGFIQIEFHRLRVKSLSPL